MLEGPGQGQAEEGILLDAADTSFQDLLRSCVTGGTRVQEMNLRRDRVSNPLRDPGDVDVDSAALLSLLCTLLSGRKHAMLHTERKTPVNSGHLSLLHGLKFHHHHLLSVGYILPSTCSFICNQHSRLQKYTSIPIQPIIITVQMGTPRLKRISLSCPKLCSSYVHNSGLLMNPTLSYKPQGHSSESSLKIVCQSGMGDKSRRPHDQCSG